MAEPESAADKVFEPRPASKRVVLIAVDPSEQAESAFHYYSDYLSLPDSEVIVLHAPELSNVAMRLQKGDKAPYEDYEKIWAEEQKKWKDLQEKYEALIKEKQLEGRFEVEASHKPGEAIVKAATNKAATMVVMGTRGLGSIRRTIMGSVSDYVIHHAPCPVVVYRKRDGKK